MTKLLRKKTMKDSENGERSILVTELAKYESLPLAKRDENIICWWKSEEKSLPNLAKYARRYLAISASSAESERVFSTTGNITEKKRNKLSAAKVENLAIIKKNWKEIEEKSKIVAELELDKCPLRVQAFDNIRFDVEKLVGMSADPSDSEESDLELDDMTI